MDRSANPLHEAAFEWVRRYANADPITVLDLGGRDINGTCRPHFPNAIYTALDIAPGPGVDIVADAATWIPDREWDVVLAAEVFEHTPVWREITATAFTACAPGGCFIVTCAGPGRFQHSAVDGGDLFDGEWYQNIDPDELSAVLSAVGFVDVWVDQSGEDVRAYGRKPS